LGSVGVVKLFLLSIYLERLHMQTNDLKIIEVVNYYFKGATERNDGPN